MPFTPFHFGAGAGLHAIAPRSISFVAFCASNVLIDIEPLYYMIKGEFRLHRFFHTCVGATLVIAATVALFLFARRVAVKWHIPDWFQWSTLSVRSVVIGASLGAYSHLLLDGIMHRDMKPLAPFSDANPLLGAMSLSALHWGCIVSLLIGLIALAIRKRIASDTPS